MTSLVTKIRNLAIGIGVATALAFPVYSYYFPDYVKTRITDAQMAKVNKRFMIATDYQPFENHDAWYRLKFNSGSIQNQAIRLKGKEVRIKKYGWRIPVLSKYENILRIEEIQTE